MCAPMELPRLAIRIGRNACRGWRRLGSRSRKLGSGSPSIRRTRISSIIIRSRASRRVFPWGREPRKSWRLLIVRVTWREIHPVQGFYIQMLLEISQIKKMHLRGEHTLLLIHNNWRGEKTLLYNFSAINSACTCAAKRKSSQTSITWAACKKIIHKTSPRMRGVL